MPNSVDAHMAARLALAAFMGRYPAGDANPLHTVHAAKLLRDGFAQLLGEAVGQARGAGASWDEVGGYVFDKLPNDPATEAWDRFAPLPPMPQDPRYLAWRCAGPDGCGQMIRDHNPIGGVAEEGHADDCARHARDLADQTARRDRINGGE